MAKRNELEKKIRAILADDPKSRNSDIRLTQMIWWRYYQDKIVMHNAGNGSPKACVALEDLFDLPREDNVKRIRAKIQNDLKEFLPTDPAVARKRGWEIEEWRDYLGYGNEAHL